MIKWLAHHHHHHHQSVACKDVSKQNGTAKTRTRKGGAEKGERAGRSKHRRGPVVGEMVSR